MNHQIDTELKEKITEWLENELIGTAYIWEKQSNPMDDSTAQSMSSCMPPDTGYYSWVETHQVDIDDATLFEQDEESILVKVDANLYYSEGKEDDEDDVLEEKWESDTRTYYVRIQGENMGIEAMD